MLGTVSINNWIWLARPGAKIENGRLIEGDDVIPYCPGENIKEILNAVQKIIDENSVLDFARRWGMLGVWRGAPEREDFLSQVIGAADFTYATRKKENLAIDFESIYAEVIKFFNPDGPDDGFELPPGESVAGIIYFAQRIRYLSEVKRLHTLCREDKLAGAYEARKWVNSLTPEWKEIIFGDIDLLEKIFNEDGLGSGELDFYQYIIDEALKSARFSFSHCSQRRVWIQLYTSLHQEHPQGFPEGFPVFQFDGLHCFIEYMLLVEGGPSPKRCADPKCGQLFFPARADQAYCPPPPGVKRSRCENRHGAYLRRHGIQASKRRKANG